MRLCFHVAELDNIFAEVSMNSLTSPKTPIKSVEQQVYSPVILARSPAELANQQNLTGLPRVVRDIVADVYNNIQKWNNKHIEGAKLVQQIAFIKSEASEQLPPSLEPTLKQLYDVVQCLTIYVNALNTSNSQISSLVHAQKQPEAPVFCQLPLNSISQLINDIANAYSLEFKAKEYVLENIAYSRSKVEAMFFSANWVHQTKVTKNINLKLELLLVETGHRKIV